jgi:hypothetical protein
MLQKTWSALKWVFRASWKCIKLLFLLSLPLTLLPGISGLINGLYYTYWSGQQYEQSIHAFYKDLKGLSENFGFADYSFRDFQGTANDYRVMRINSEDWAKKLGFVLPQEYYMSEQYPDTPIDRHTSLETLMLDTTCPTSAPCRPKAPKEQWVYISNYALESFM